MANSIANVRIVLSYPQPGGGVASPSLPAVLAEYQALALSVLDIPDAQAADTEHEVAFGSIAAASMIVVQNLTGQDIDVMVNDTGADVADHSIPIGGVWVCGGLVPAVLDFPVAKMSLFTTAEQVDAGTINVWVFGDPE